MFNFFEGSFVKMIALSWILSVGVFFISCYFFYDKSRFFNSVGDFFIELSIIKRTKTILLSYAFIAIFVGIVGIIWEFFIVRYG